MRANNYSVALVFLCACALVTSQITFSRDWSGGKRAAPLAVDCASFSRVCRHFVEELKAAMAHQREVKVRRAADDNPPPTYDDDA